MGIIDELRKALHEYNIVKIKEEHYHDIYQLQKENRIYFEYTKEYPPKYEDIIAEVMELPPHTDISQKYYLGFYLDDRLIGVMDLIDGYPDKNTYWIGLFILDINYQGLGIGTKIISKCIELSDKKIQLGCLSNNKEGLAFWSKFNFKEVRRSYNKDKDWEIIVMERKKEAD